jgi:FHA domain-containing protein
MKVAVADVEEYRFLVVKGANPGSKLAFKPTPRVIRIGRAVDNDIVISDPAVSRTHARVEIREDGSTTILDAGSSTGVEKMGFRVGGNAEPLESGDEFKMGDTILRFEIAAKKGAIKKAAAKESEAQAEARKPAKTTGLAALLARLGLTTPARKLAAAALVIVLAALALWPTPEGLPPQFSDQRLPINYDSVVGFIGPDRAHLDKAIFEFPTNSEGLGIFFRLLAPSGVDVSAGGHAISKIEPAKDWVSYELLTIPKAIGSGPKGALMLDNLGYSPSDGDRDPSTVVPWGVQRMWLILLPTVGSTEGQLVESLKALRDLFERLSDNPGNRYSLVTGLRASSIGLMKLTGRGALLVQIPSKPVDPQKAGEALQTARTELEAGHADKSLHAATEALAMEEAEVDREYRAQMNLLALARKAHKAADEGQVLAVATRMIQDPVDPRYRAVRAMVRKLSGRARENYDDTLRDLTR